MTKINYHGVKILAPMVRVSTAPMRLLSLKYGADLVYTPEIIDRRMMVSQRIENKRLGTIDYVNPQDESLTLRIHPSECSRLVVQLGSSRPDHAAQAAAVIADTDVAGIDLNCGCPKRFSIINAMGAALLTEPDTLCGILDRLVAEKPTLAITAKIRMLPEVADTIALAKRIEATGVQALALHCRYRDQRPREPGHWSIFRPVADAIRIPLIANGDVMGLRDWTQLTSSAHGVAGVMVARAAQYNPSCFAAAPLPGLAIIREYVLVATMLDMPYGNVKYTLCLMWSALPHTRRLEKSALVPHKSLRELIAYLGLAEEWATQWEPLPPHERVQRWIDDPHVTDRIMAMPSPVHLSTDAATPPFTWIANAGGLLPQGHKHPQGKKQGVPTSSDAPDARSPASTPAAPAPSAAPAHGALPVKRPLAETTSDATPLMPLEAGGVGGLLVASDVSRDGDEPLAQRLKQAPHAPDAEARPTAAPGRTVGAMAEPVGAGNAVS